MLIIRPIRASDFPALRCIAEESGHGFTSLPVNDELLTRKIARSEASFAKAVETPFDEGYLMVLEDTETQEVVAPVVWKPRWEWKMLSIITVWAQRFIIRRR